MKYFVFIYKLFKPWTASRQPNFKNKSRWYVLQFHLFEVFRDVCHFCWSYSFQKQSLAYWIQESQVTLFPVAGAIQEWQLSAICVAKITFIAKLVKVNPRKANVRVWIPLDLVSFSLRLHPFSHFPILALWMKVITIYSTLFTVSYGINF